MPASVPRPVSEAKPWKERLGKLGYVVGAVIAGFRSAGHAPPRHGRRDGARRRAIGGCSRSAVGNGPFVGGGTPLTPDADPTDGKVDVMVSFAVRRRERLLYAIHLKRGTHDERHDVQTMRATRVEIAGALVHVQRRRGAGRPDRRRRRWELKPGAFTMMLPTSEQAEIAD